MKDAQYVGLDVHKQTISVAVAKMDRGDAVSLGTIPNDSHAVAKLLRRLGPAEHLHFCYEAGPCGYSLYRQLIKAGATCEVVAPSLIPRRPGDQVKTDRRDAEKLARLYRSGELAPVWVPDEQQEALRDLARAREDAKEDQLSKRHQLSKFLLRLDVRPPEGIRAWTKAHRTWTIGLRFSQELHQVVLADYIHALDEADARLERLEKELLEQAKSSPLGPVIDALQCLRGVGGVTAITIATELGDLTRFPKAKQAMDYVGLVPSEYSSGGKRHQGAITKSGNSHARFVLVEAAWHYRYTPRVGDTLRKRQQGLPEEVIRIAWKAQHRLNSKYRRMTGRGKPRQVAAVAVARELIGFMWAIAQEMAQRKAGRSVA